MGITWIVGMLAVAVTLLGTAGGYASQVWKNYRNKSTEGLSWFTFASLLVSHSVWFAYGVLGGDWFLIIANVPGVVCMTIIQLQWWWYKVRV